MITIHDRFNEFDNELFTPDIASNISYFIPNLFTLTSRFFIPFAPDEINISTLGAVSTSSRVWLPGCGGRREEGCSPVYLISDETNRIGGAWSSGIRKKAAGFGGWKGNEEGTLRNRDSTPPPCLDLKKKKTKTEGKKNWENSSFHSLERKIPSLPRRKVSFPWIDPPIPWFQWFQVLAVFPFSRPHQCVYNLEDRPPSGCHLQFDSLLINN